MQKNKSRPYFDLVLGVWRRRRTSAGRPYFPANSTHNKRPFYPTQQSDNRAPDRSRPGGRGASTPPRGVGGGFVGVVELTCGGGGPGVRRLAGARCGGCLLSGCLGWLTDWAAQWEASRPAAHPAGRPITAVTPTRHMTPGDGRDTWHVMKLVMTQQAFYLFTSWPSNWWKACFCACGNSDIFFLFSFFEKMLKMLVFLSGTQSYLFLHFL